MFAGVFNNKCKYVGKNITKLCVTSNKVIQKIGNAIRENIVVKIIRMRKEITDKSKKLFS
jgi:hypothetical protein